MPASGLANKMNTFSGGFNSSSEEILVGLGANLSTSEYGGPRETLSAALTRFPQHGIAVLRRSRWYASAPVPASDQPWFVNAIVAVAYRHEPSNLLAVLHDIENEYGRQRRRLWEARPIDLDLIAYGARTTPAARNGQGPGSATPACARARFRTATVAGNCAHLAPPAKWYPY